MKHKKIISLALLIAAASVAGNVKAWFGGNDEAAPAIHDGNSCSSKVESVVGTVSNAVAGEDETARKTGYREVQYPSDNYARDKVNDVKGVILHHTAEPTVQRSLAVLTSKEKGVSTHVVIDTDGTRYIMVPPTTVAYHAGYSLLNGRERCNEWCLGIEFQGNTLKAPLTQDQIDSAIEWLLPLIAQYDIPVANIATHEMIRSAYKKAHPGAKAYDKPDITQTEYRRFMKQLHDALGY